MTERWVPDPMGNCRPMVNTFNWLVVRMEPRSLGELRSYKDLRNQMVVKKWRFLTSGDSFPGGMPLSMMGDYRYRG